MYRSVVLYDVSMQLSLHSLFKRKLHRLANLAHNLNTQSNLASGIRKTKGTIPTRELVRHSARGRKKLCISSSLHTLP